MIGMDVSAFLDSFIDICEDKIAPAGRRAYDKASGKLKELLSAARGVYGAFAGKTEKARRLKKIWDDERFADAKALVLKTLLRLLKEMLPVKGSGAITYGAGDPAGTAAVMQAAAVLYPFCGESFEITPDFEGSTLDADIDIRGRVRIYVFVFAALRLLACKQIRTMYKLVRRALKEQPGSGTD